nr:hypothetical protein [Tanacetum cinerariifolium]
MALVSSNSTSGPNETDTIASGVSTALFMEMELHWEMAMLTIRARRFMKGTCINLDISCQRIGFDKSKGECFNCHKNGYFARECRALKNLENRGREYGRKTIPVESLAENAFIAQYSIGGYDWSYQAKEEIP